jgi:hypothetical protein
VPGLTAIGAALAALLGAAPGPTLPEDPFTQPREGDAGSMGPQDPPEPTGPNAATHGMLRARVMAMGRRDPVAEARVIPVEGEAATTDAEGRVELWLEPGEHSLLIRADGYQELHIEVTIERGKAHQFVYRLDEDPGGHPYRTEVETERATAISKTTLRDDEIRAVPGTGGDPFGVVKSMPGASQLAGFLPYVVVRGAAPGNTGYYLDGARVPILFHVAVGPSVIHPYFIDEVDFYASGAPVRLGRYASGIVEGRTKPAARDRVHGDVDLRLTDIGLLLDVPVHRALLEDCKETRKIKCRKGPAKGSLTLGGRYSYTGLVLSLLPQLNVKIAYWDYQARFDHDLGRRSRYTAFVYGSFDELGQRQTFVDEDDGTVTLDRDPDPFVRFEFHRIDQRVRTRLRGGGSLLTAVTLGLDRTGLQEIKTNEWRVAPRIQARIPLARDTTLGVGLDQEFQRFVVDEELLDLDNENSVEDLGQVFNNRFVSSTGLWLDLRWAGPVFEVRPGVRADLYAQVGRSPLLPQARSVTRAFGVDPRLLLRQQVGERIALRQSIGIYHQPPASPIPIPGVESLGFERGLQRNVQGSFGYELELGQRALLTQEIYVGRLSNLQDYEIQTDQDRVNELEDLLIAIDGWSYGLESMIRLVSAGRAFGWVAYTLSRSAREYPVTGTAASSWDQRHILNLVLGYRINRKWRVGGRLHFNSGRPYTSRRIQTDGQLEPLEQAIQNHRNDSNLPPFLQFDLRVERIFTFRLWSLSAYLDVANSTFAREVFACSPGDQEGSTVQVGCEHESTGLRYVLPALGLRARF